MGLILENKSKMVTKHHLQNSIFVSHENNWKSPKDINKNL